MDAEMRAIRGTRVKVTLETLSLVGSAGIGFGFDSLLKDQANWGTWSGFLELLILAPITCLLFISLIGKVRALRALVTMLVEPALKVTRACFVVAASALLSSAFFDWHVLWFDLLAVALDACMVWFIFNTFNRVGKIVERELGLR